MNAFVHVTEMDSQMRKCIGDFHCNAIENNNHDGMKLQ